MSTQVSRVFEFGPFRLDEAECQLFRAGEPVPLPPKVFDTLMLLIEHRGHLVGKDELMSRLWPDSFVEEVSLNRSISTLRKALGETTTAPLYVETVPKRGYRFIAPVVEVSGGDELFVERRRSVEIITEEVEEIISPYSEPSLEVSSTAAGLQRIVQAPVISLVPKPDTKTRRSILIAAVVFAALAAAASAYFRTSNRGGPTPANAPMKSMAVLPLKSFTPGTEDEPLRLRITDALITSLGGLKDVAVRPTSSVLRFAGEGQDVIEAGKMLGVDAVLDGRVQTENDRLRVTLQLVSVRNGEQLWAEQFDGRAGEILALQDAISSHLRQKFGFAESEKSGRRPTENNEAYEAYLKGRYLWNQRTAEAYWKALDYFQQSVVADPKFALGYTGIADCYSLLEQRNVLPADEAFQKADAAARKALELDSMLAEAHTSMGVIGNLYNWRWGEAEAHYRRAIELNPNYSGAPAYYGMLLNSRGRFDEAFAQLKKAEKLDPTSLNIGIYLGANFYFSKQFERAVAQFNRVLEFSPNASRSYLFLTRIYELEGRFDEAVDAELKTRAMSPHPQSVEQLRAAYQTAGIRGFWQKEIKLLKEESGGGHGLDYHIASRYALLGDADNALAYLEKNQKSRGSMWNMLNVDPLFDSLRSNPKFQVLVSKMFPPN